MRTYKLAVSAVTLSMVGVGAGWADDVQTEALNLAQLQKYDDALALLNAADKTSEADLSQDLLKARLLSWAGRYGEAHTLLSELKSEHPDDTEIDVIFGSLYYYQGKLEPAEQSYALALSRTPEHGDAISGMDRVQKAKEAKRIADLKWRVDAGGSYSSFKGEAAEDWNEQYINVQRRTGDVAVSVGVHQYRRFGKSDTQVKIGAASTKRGGIDWSVEASATPDADFRPDASIGGRAGKAIEVTKDIDAYLALGYRYDSFETGAVQTLQPELTAHFSNGVELTSKLVVTTQENADTQTGYLVQGVFPVAKTVRLKLGYADAPEVINGQAVGTKSVFGGVSFDVSSTLTFHANAARQDRADNITRDDFLVGFTRKF